MADPRFRTTDYRESVVIHGDLEVKGDITGSIISIKGNFTAIVPPTVNDDITEGFSAGSPWVDTVGEETYKLVDATAGAAVWVKTSLTADELGSMAFQNSTSVNITGGVIGGITNLGLNGPIHGTTTGDILVISGGPDDTAGANIQFHGSTATDPGDTDIRNGTEIVTRFNGVASAVNYLDITNSALGEDVLIIPAGTDTDIDLAISAKGAGLIAVGSPIITSFVVTGPDFEANSTTIDAGGFSGTEATHIDIITGAIPEFTSLAVHRVTVDKSDANADAFTSGYVVSATNGPSVMYHSVSNLNVRPIGQIAGVEINPTTALVNAVDELADLTNAGTSTNIFVNDNDILTIGFTTNVFRTIDFLLSVVSSGGGISPVFEYSTGVGTWATLVLSNDGTDGMRNSGLIAWVTAAVAGWATGSGGDFLIRITRTRNSLSTTPVLDLVQIAAISFFEWLEDGSLVINAISAAGDLVFVGDNPEILGGDTDGVLHISAGVTKDLGANVIFYADTHSTKAKDIEFRSDTTDQLVYDDSASSWDFKTNNVSGIGTLVSGNHTIANGSIVVTQSTASAAITVTQNTNADGVIIQGTGVTTNQVLQLTATALTSGDTFRATATNAGFTGFVARLSVENSSSSGTCLKADTVGTGNCANFLSSGTSATAAVNIAKTNASTSGHIMRVEFIPDAPNDTTQAFVHFRDNSADRLFIYSSGTLLSATGVYGSISARKLKTDITEDGELRSYWDDLLRVRPRKYRMKSDIEQYGPNCDMRIGYVQDEVKEIFPGLAPESLDFEDVIVGNSPLILRMKTVNRKEIPDLDEEGNEQFDGGEDIIEVKPVLDEEGNQTKTGWLKNNIMEGPILLSVVQEIMNSLVAAGIPIIKADEVIEIVPEVPAPPPGPTPEEIIAANLVTNILRLNAPLIIMEDAIVTVGTNQLCYLFGGVVVNTNHSMLMGILAHSDTKIITAIIQEPSEEDLVEGVTKKGKILYSKTEEAVTFTWEIVLI